MTEEQGNIIKICIDHFKEHNWKSYGIIELEGPWCSWIHVLCEQNDSYTTCVESFINSLVEKFPSHYQIRFFMSVVRVTYKNAVS